MPVIDPKTLREQFKTAAARAAFDRLNALGRPHWATSKETSGDYYLSPNASTKKIGGCGLLSLDSCFGKALDDIVIRLEQKLIDRASEPGTIVVVHPYEARRAEFVYDQAAKAFKPFRP
jgi:hypothetical protein